MEGVGKNITNIGNTHGVVVSATDLLGKTKTGQPATDGADQRAEEEEVEENRREKRRIERKEERAVYALLQECKRYRDLEKAIQAEDDRIRNEDEDKVLGIWTSSQKGLRKGKVVRFMEPGRIKR